MSGQAARPAGDFDIETQLLLDAVYLKYHYDFRGYAMASRALAPASSVRKCSMPEHGST